MNGYYPFINLDSSKRKGIASLPITELESQSAFSINDQIKISLSNLIESYGNSSKTSEADHLKTSKDRLKTSLQVKNLLVPFTTINRTASEKYKTAVASNEFSSEPIKADAEIVLPSSSPYLKINSGNSLRKAKPDLSIQPEIVPTAQPFKSTASSLVPITKNPIVTMKPFSISLKLSVPTPPPAKTIQSAPIHTLIELNQSAVKEATNANSSNITKATNVKSSNITSLQNWKEQANVAQSQLYSEGDKSTSDINMKNKQNAVLFLNNNQASENMKFRPMLAETQLKNSYLSKPPSADKKTSEKDLLNYIKSLVKEASMEKSQTLG